MIKVLEDALAKMLRLPEDKQEVAAELLEQLAAADSETYPLFDDERAIIREAFERARRGEFATDDQVDAALRRPWA